MVYPKQKSRAGQSRRTQKQGKVRECDGEGKKRG
jgi:hypothetical protein